MVYDQVESTQDVARGLLEAGEAVGVVFAHDQTAGRGRFRREWVSRPGESLTMSLVFDAYAEHREAWWVGMCVALTVARAVHCQVQWPNDLSVGARKVGGILTEMVRDSGGRLVPVVGVGLNLGQREFPAEIADRATSLALAFGVDWEAEALARRLLSGLAGAPEPSGWDEIGPAWGLFDATPGKGYVLADGTRATAIGIGPGGALICSVDGETRSVLVGDAVFGEGRG